MSQDTSTRICLAADQRGYCGRKPGTLTTHTPTVTCRDCAAAVRADQHAGILSTDHTPARSSR